MELHGGKNDSYKERVSISLYMYYKGRNNSQNDNQVSDIKL